MILDHFRTTSKDEVLFNASHIYKLQYRGDKEMDKFLNAWIEIIANMKVEDIPSDNTLRDHLLRKIDGSQALHVDLTIFKGRDNDDKRRPTKSYWRSWRGTLLVCVRTETLKPETNSPQTTPILVSQLPLHQSLRLQHLHRRMVLYTIYLYVTCCVVRSTS